MEVKSLDVLKGKITTIYDEYLAGDFKTNASVKPLCLFNINLYEDIVYNNRDINKDELFELLNIFDLDKNILKKNYTEISKSEYNKILLIIPILENNPVLFLEDPTVGLDVKSKKTLVKLLKRQKMKNRIIIIKSNDSEFVFSVTNIVIYKSGYRYMIDDNKYNFFSNKKLLKEFDIEQPSIMEFYGDLKSKKIKGLLHRDNINDLIKEIYRNA